MLCVRWGVGGEEQALRVSTRIYAETQPTPYPTPYIDSQNHTHTTIPTHKHTDHHRALPLHLFRVDSIMTLELMFTGEEEGGYTGDRCQWQEWYHSVRLVLMIVCLTSLQ